VRPVDRLIVGYLILSAGEIVLFRNGEGAGAPIALGHGAVALAILLGSRLRPARGVLRLARDWYPLAVILGAYAEFRWLAQLPGGALHDPVIAGLEARLFGGQPSQTFHAAAPWPLLAEYLHLCYVSYYAIPLTLPIWLFTRREAARFSEALTAILGSFLVCCLVYIVFPVAGPYHHIGHPRIADVAGLVPPIAHRIIQAGSSVGTAFPSSHTAVAVAVWLASWRLARTLFWVLALIVPGLAFGTVYGGFHYAVDTIAGVAIGAASVAAAAALHARDRLG